MKTLQLLISKRLFIEATSYADRGEPLAAGIAISMFQDAIELYIWTLIKENSIQVKDISPFTENIKAIKSANLAFPYEAKVLELNKVRVAFKHYGSLPDPSEARKYHTYTEDFLREAMQSHFSVNFDELSLVDLVTDKAIQTQLRVAESEIKVQNFQEASSALAKAKTLAFNQMQKYIPKAKNFGISSSNEVDKLADYLEVLREAALVVMLQISVDDYAFLRKTLPNASQSFTGTWFVMGHRSVCTEAECRQALAALVIICQKLELRA